MEVVKDIFKFATAFCIDRDIILDLLDIFGLLKLNRLEAVIWAFVANIPNAPAVAVSPALPSKWPFKYSILNSM